MTRQLQPIRSEDVHPLTDFLRSHRQAVERLKETGRPELLTVHGKAAVVVLDAGAYQRLFDLAEEMETWLAVQEGLDSVAAGDGLSPDEFRRRFRSRRAIQGDRGATGTDGP